MTDDCMTEFRIRCPDFPPRFDSLDLSPTPLPRGFDSWMDASANYEFFVRSTPEYNFGTRLLHPFGIFCFLTGFASILNPKAGGRTIDSFWIMVALLLTTVKCFSTWKSVEILWRRVLLSLLTVTDWNYRVQSLIRSNFSTFVIYVSVSLRFFFCKSIHMFRNEMGHMCVRCLDDTENHNGNTRNDSSYSVTQWTRVGGGQMTSKESSFPRSRFDIKIVVIIVVIIVIVSVTVP